VALRPRFSPGVLWTRGSVDGVTVWYGQLSTRMRVGVARVPEHPAFLPVAQASH
jgi:hypothetical protein